MPKSIQTVVKCLCLICAAGGAFYFGIFSGDSPRYDTILLEADLAANAGKHDKAIELLNSLPPAFEQHQIHSGWQRKAILLFEQGRITDAIAAFRSILKHRTNDNESRRRLARILSGFGLRFEALRLLQQNLNARDVCFDDVVCLARNGRRLWGQLELKRMHQRQPSEPLPIVGLVTHAINARDNAAIHYWLSAKVADHPRLLALRRQHGRMPERRRQRETTALMSALLQNSDEHPDDWNLLATWAAHSGGSTLSKQSLLRAVELDPYNNQLIHALSEMTRTTVPDVSLDLLRLWKQLNQIEQLASDISVNRWDTSLMERLAATLTNIGRRQEAAEWARIALRSDVELRWARELIRQQADTKRPAESPPWRHPLQRLAESLRNSPDMELPQWTAGADTELRKTDWGSMFQDVARNTGMNFTYDNGAKPGMRGLLMHQWTGGGVGVLDFDADDYPDVYLSQGGNLPSANGFDQCFRNVCAERFVEVTKSCRIVESEFGQGVAVGDINNDGFDDILVANVGRNRLLLNQGDGTFCRTELPSPPAWTTSAAIADLNADGIPDIYETNYLCGDGVFEQTCPHKGMQRVCGPMDFEAAKDQILMADGTGNFNNASSVIAEHFENSRGMGVLIGNLDGKPGNEIFVANDETANQLIRISGSAATETGVTSGVALNHFGQQQGSMGIGCGDADNNGLPDLFVTNYYSEGNTLYSQLSSGTFVDASEANGLSAISLTMLGFGCQFEDFDNDGDADLVVVNGHLDDFRHLGHPWKMRPQLLENDGSGHFSEAEFDTGYFAADQLGRALSVLDWNVDGRSDFIVTALDTPVQLMENSTAPVDSCLTVKLVGTQSARTAVGAVVRIEAEDHSQSRWLTAGDGYQCSNEKALRFAFPDASCISKLTVYWPGGTVQRFGDIPFSGRITIIEGRANLFNLR